jgi:exodeoxyribonuclease VII small subunit
LHKRGIKKCRKNRWKPARQHNQLEILVQRMEGGELSLEDSLKEFERGVTLTRLCQDALKAAEQRVKLLSADGQASDFPSMGDA